MVRSWAAAVLLGAGMFASGVHAGDESEPSPTPTIYKWVDENGVAHYTTDPDRIPESLRHRFRGIRFRGREAPAPARSGDPWLESDARPEGPAGGDPPVAERDLDAEIAALETEVAREEERMKALVSDPGAAAAPLPADPEFREAARRLPELQARLRALRAQRARAPDDTPR